MKFMKLGSKPDLFQTDGHNVRYVATELASDVVISIGELKFYLHKFPLLSKSSYLQKLVTTEGEGNGDDIHINDIPGGATAFEVCAKFCYGMTVTVNAYNVAAVRCAAEYLGMYETIEKGNLIYKIDVFLSSSVFHSWKDSIIVLQTVKSLSPLCEELKIIGRGIDAIASRATTDVSMVNWSYSYNRRKLPEENGNDQSLNGVTRMVPEDWWVEDLCELDINFYKQLIISIKNKGIVSHEVIGESLKAYSYRRLPGFVKGINPQSDIIKYRSILEAIMSLLPAERGSVSTSFLLKLLKVATLLDSAEAAKGELVKRIGQQLEDAKVNDLLIRTSGDEATMYDVDLVSKILEEFIVQNPDTEILFENDYEIKEVRRPGILSEASKLMVVKLIDSYLAEIAKDSQLPLSSFLSIAEMTSSFTRPSHDGLYRAIDTYLKEHPDTSKSERKRICKLMDCKKLSAEACTHAVQNERLPMRVVVQVLFFEQARATASSGRSTPDLPRAMRDLNSTSIGSSRTATPTATHTEEDWDGVATAEELRALKGELAALKLAHGSMSGRNSIHNKSPSDKATIGKMKSLLTTRKIFSKIWSKGGQGGNSSDSSDSHDSANLEDAKFTPSRKGRNSVS